MDKNDLLYLVFEKHLLIPHTEEQDLEEFAAEVVVEYLTLLAKQGVTVPQKLRSILEMDLIEDVVDMTRKKTYGHVNIKEFRQKNAELIEVYQKRSA